MLIKRVYRNICSSLSAYVQHHLLAQDTVSTKIEEIILRCSSLCIKTTNEIGPLSCNSSLSFCQRLPSLQILVRGFFCLFRDIGKGEVWLVNLPIGIKRQLVEYNENGRHCIAG